MNKSTTVVIAAGAVLAAVIVTRTPAQQEYGGFGACCLPTGGCADKTSEPGCIAAGGTWLGAFTTCISSTCPSVEPPTVVSAFGTTNLVTRVWSDGHVDRIVVNDNGCSGEASCVWTIIQGTCPTDINRDGDTGIQDFLTLLGGWGACR